jgi:hypothetical protein
MFLISEALTHEDLQRNRRLEQQPEHQRRYRRDNQMIRANIRHKQAGDRMQNEYINIL